MSEYFGNRADIWLRMQQTYDLWHIEKELKSELSQIRVAERTRISPVTHKDSQVCKILVARETPT